MGTQLSTIISTGTMKACAPNLIWHGSAKPKKWNQLLYKLGGGLLSGDNEIIPVELVGKFIQPWL